jgi:hypothetical protein
MVWPSLAAVLGGFPSVMTSWFPAALEHHIHLLDHNSRQGMHLVEGHGHGLPSSFPVYTSLSVLELLS